MPGSDLSSELRRRAEQSSERTLRGAEASVEQIERDADAAIEQRRSTVLANRESEYRAAARSEVASERQKAMRAVLEARARLVQRVLERAKSLLSEAAVGPDYRQSLQREIRLTAEYLGSDGATVHCSPGLDGPIREALRGKPSVSIEPTLEDAHGFVAIGGGGAVRVDGTLEARLRRLAPSLAIAINERLEAD